eukprot:PhF_6_TR8885/c0_g1_i1/m.14053
MTDVMFRALNLSDLRGVGLVRLTVTVSTTCCGAISAMFLRRKRFDFRPFPALSASRTSGSGSGTGSGSGGFSLVSSSVSSRTSSGFQRTMTVKSFWTPLVPVNLQFIKKLAKPHWYSTKSLFL